MSTAEPGWDDGAFACSSCCTRFRTGEDRFGTVVDLHDQVHEAAEVLARLSGAGLDEALPTAAAMVRALVLDVSPAAAEVLRPAWDALVTAG